MNATAACFCRKSRLELTPLKALLAVQGHFLERNHERSFELSSHAAQDFKGLCPRHGGLVSAIFDQCRKNISEMVKIRTMSDISAAQRASGYPLPSRYS